MLVVCWIHQYQELLFASNGATGALCYDKPHEMILSDRVKYYQCLRCLESSSCVHYTQFVLLSIVKNTIYYNYYTTFISVNTLVSSLYSEDPQEYMTKS